LPRDADGRHELDALLRQISQIALVEIPVENLARVAHQDAARDARVEPGAKLGRALEVVPGRAHDERVEAAPIDVRATPYGGHRADSNLFECGDQQEVIDVEMSELLARHEGDARPG